ncbi:MAG: Mut7-C RNAse domain-containing protein [Nitrospirae bacterium]|nr:Mut7-C RNAse domain-containing protein [Nitrospirota bacterium]
MIKLIADSMLGKLAIWLRVLGYDTLYFKEIDDASLLRMAKEEDRILLTRDTSLIKRRGIKNYVFINDNEPYKQLKQIITALKLKSDKDFLTRCIYCNEELITVQKEDVEGIVPEYVYENHNSFNQCRKCKKIYWRGTHFRRIENRLAEIFS